MKTPKILMILGTVLLMSGCTSMTSVTEAVTEAKKSLALDNFPFSAAPKRLTDDEVRVLFVGNTVESHNQNTRLNSITYYHPNGQAIQQRLWSKRLGKWAIEDNGQICLAFGDRPMKCRYIVKDGDRYYKVRANSDGKMEKIVRYRYFATGNRIKDGG